MTQELSTAWSSMKDKSASFKTISRGWWTEEVKKAGGENGFKNFDDKVV